MCSFQGRGGGGEASFCPPRSFCLSSHGLKKAAASPDIMSAFKGGKGGEGFKDCTSWVRAFCQESKSLPNSILTDSLHFMGQNLVPWPPTSSYK